MYVLMPVCAPLTFLLSLLLLLVSPHGTLPVAADELVDGMVITTVFASHSCPNCIGGQTDGPSGAGTIFRAGGAMIGMKPDTVFLTDRGGGGSTVRVVDKSGLHTIAGSRTETGLKDGPANGALFNEPTAIAGVEETLYVADTGNNLIRRIEKGVVSTFLTNTQVSAPRYILPYKRPEGTYDLFVSDTAQSRIIFVAMAGNPVVSVYVTGFQPGVMQIDTINNRMYVIRDQSQVVVVDMNSAVKDPHYWTLGNISCMGYRSGLMLSPDGSELFFFGITSGKEQILALPTSATEAQAPSICPRVVMSWTKADIVSLVNIDARSFYVVTDVDVYLLREDGYTPTPTPTTTVTPTPTPTPTVTPIPPPVRGLGIAAFPTSSLPVFSPVLMHQLYSWMMKDVGIAFESNDFIAVFQPPGNDVPGDVNVSGWNNLTTLLSQDGSITITEYLAPQGMARDEAQSRLFASPWYWTRLFLATVSQQSPNTTLGPFCMLHCTTDCVNLSYKPEMCADYVPPPACDEVCAGAIASSAVLGVTAATLLGLMIASPANVLSAVLLVPAV